MVRLYVSSIGNVVPLMKQTYGYCGPTSVRIDALRYGIVIPEKEIARRSLEPSKEYKDWEAVLREDGVEWDGLVRAARSIGLQAEKDDNCTIDDLVTELKKGRTPLVDWMVPAREERKNGKSHIVWVGEGHYSVVADVTDKYIMLADPYIGRIRKMEHVDFLRWWFDFDNIPPKRKEDFYLHRMIRIWKRSTEPLSRKQLLALERRQKNA